MRLLCRLSYRSGCWRRCGASVHPTHVLWSGVCVAGRRPGGAGVAHGGRLRPCSGCTWPLAGWGGVDPRRVLVVCVVLDVDGRVFGLVVGGHFFGGVGVVVVPLVEEFCACHVDVVVCPGFAAGVAEEFDVHDAHRLFLIRCSVRRMSMIRYTGRFHWSSCNLHGR